MSESTKFLLSEEDIPRAWYNIQADLPEPLPPVIHPGTMQPIGPEDLARGMSSSLSAAGILRLPQGPAANHDSPKDRDGTGRRWQISPDSRFSRIDCKPAGFALWFRASGILARQCWARRIPAMGNRAQTFPRSRKE